MEENDELFLANPINVNEKPKINNFENEVKIKGIDKIIAFDETNCCMVIFLLFVSILFIWLPFVFYLFLFRISLKKIFYIDEEETELVFGNQGLFGCCICCVFNRKTYIIKEINKVILYKEPKPNSKKKIVNCEFYMVDGSKQDFFQNWPFKDEKLNELEAFFRRHFDIQIVDRSEQNVYTNK